MTQNIQPAKPTKHQAEKPSYAPPSVTSYTVDDLTRQLGPARAQSISPFGSPDEEVFGSDY